MHMWPASMEIFVENTIKLQHNKKGLTLTQLVWGTNMVVVTSCKNTLSLSIKVVGLLFSFLVVISGRLVGWIPGILQETPAEHVPMLTS